MVDSTRKPLYPGRNRQVPPVGQDQTCSRRMSTRRRDRVVSRTVDYRRVYKQLPCSRTN